MPRKTRIEIRDGLYHIINRGNYRSDIFENDQDKASFEQTIFEACEKAGWRLFAYVIMKNHYHLAIGTPQGNLISGMQWLQSTFANRFNRFRKERGHVCFRDATNRLSSSHRRCAQWSITFTLIRFEPVW